MTRPIALPVNVEGIPDVLKLERRWICWRYVWKAKENKAGRWIKLPSGRTNDPSTWLTFDQALATYQAGGFDGVGFCLGDRWAGIDLDNVLTHPAIDRIACYRETSPSGTGLKAIGRASRIGGEIKFDAAKSPVFTTWQGARFFAVTGQGSGDPTVDISDLIDNWFPSRSIPIGRERPAFIREGDTRGTERIETRTDDQVLFAAATALNRDKFLKLFRGDSSDYGGDKSRADQALVCILFHHCRGDRDQADRLFRQSALMRDKWETRSYREATLNKAAAL